MFVCVCIVFELGDGADDCGVVVFRCAFNVPKSPLCAVVNVVTCSEVIISL